MRRWDVVVVGGTLTDHVVRAARLPRAGEDLRGDAHVDGLGGKGANQAVAAARLGARVALVSRVGVDPAGVAARRALGDEHVDTRHVRRDWAAPTGSALVQLDGEGRSQVLAHLGATARLAPKQLDRAARDLAGAAIVLAQLEIPVEAVAHAAELAARAGVPFMLDAGPAHALDDALLHRCAVVRGNAHEAEAVTGVRVHDRASARAAGASLRRRGVRVAIVGAGAAGDLVIADEGELWLPRLAVRAVDPTGAGDAFAAAFAVGWARRRPVDEAARFAHAAAALTTLRIGASAAFPRRRDVDKLLARAALVDHLVPAPS